ncbi:MAG: quinolinate synthase NadA [Candidatus Diapherotrites archaeon]|uniref:Quinolinate synthase n=1 Tax=Candidatus Iainarchaeum sp. TaxID=3101447 RepID=A0A8T3YPK3_9ARCH|nr:quinolinate synthase NadA [Candidatus Diapherotrites archaeon]
MQMAIGVTEQISAEAKRLQGAMSSLGYSLNECLLFAPLTLRINTLKKERNAVILAHSYQRPEILFGIADFVGDSYGLSVEAKSTNASVIVFCGVHFMAETAKILSPGRKVLIPSLEAGCSLAESITAQDVKGLKAAHPGVPVVTYVNTSAEVKSESDACCTSANALKVIEAMPGSEVIFLPDVFMAQNLRNQTKKKIHGWNGKCVVHDTFTREQVLEYRRAYPGIKVLSHLECTSGVIEVSDFVGGTNDMYNYIKASGAKDFMVVTECGMSDLLRQRFPEKRFITPCSMCPYMKKINLQNVLESLESGRFEVNVPEGIREKAQRALDKMIEIGK